MLNHILFTVVSTAVHGVVATVAGKATKGTKVSLNPIKDSTETLFRVLELKQSKE